MNNYPSPPNYEELEYQRWIKNRNDVKKDLIKRNENLDKKIRTFSNTSIFSVDEIKEKIHNDSMFAATFAVAPMKQVFHQKIASDYIQSLPIVKKFQSLPAGGKNAWYVDAHGSIVIRKNLPKTAPPTKSLDFFWQTSDYRCFATHKYTRGHGGAQDNQYQDLYKSLNIFLQGGANDSDVLFAICDGPYYTDDSCRQLNLLNKITRDKIPKSYVVTIHDIHKVLEELANE